MAAAGKEMGIFSDAEVNKKTFELYSQPSLEEIEKLGVQMHWLSYYRKWVPQENFYYAQKNKGAYKNRQVLRIVKQPLKECLFDGAVRSRPDKYSDLFKSFKNIFPHVSGFRSIFSMALSICLLAENVFNIAVNGHTFIWDVSAAKIIIEESGGTMFDLKGKQIDFNLDNPKQEYNVIACHPRLKKEILAFFLK